MKRAKRTTGSGENEPLLPVLYFEDTKSCFSKPQSSNKLCISPRTHSYWRGRLQQSNSDLAPSKRIPMLPNEKAPHTATVETYLGDLALIAAKKLGSALVLGEHNDNPLAPMPSPTASNPAHGVNIRRIDLEKSIARSRVPVDQQCKDHNSAVQTLGTAGKYTEIF
jgi:hypothetical protein